MDLVCTCCGEPWDIYHVRYEEPEEFDRQGGLIRACPCCRGVTPEGISDGERDRLAAVAAVAELLGDDLDGLAATLEDLKLT